MDVYQKRQKSIPRSSSSGAEQSRAGTTKQDRQDGEILMEDEEDGWIIDGSGVDGGSLHSVLLDTVYCLLCGASSHKSRHSSQVPSARVKGIQGMTTTNSPLHPSTRLSAFHLPPYSLTSTHSSWIHTRTLYHKASHHVRIQEHCCFRLQEGCSQAIHPSELH